MAKARDIKKRITSVTKTRKITRTMEMVSASRLKKLQNRVLASKPYSDGLKEVLDALVGAPEVMAHPLMEQRSEIKRVALLALTSNRGLCGAFNNNISRRVINMVNEYRAKGVEVDIYLSGKRGIQFFNHQGVESVYKDVDIAENLDPDKIRELSARLTNDFTSGRIDKVEVVYVAFVSAGRQELAEAQLLPLSMPHEDERKGVETDFIFEPSTQELVNALLPLIAQNVMFRAVVETVTSSHAARRKAMKLATDNADDMITHLTRQFNRERQAQITKELSEIVGGSDAIS